MSTHVDPNKGVYPESPAVGSNGRGAAATTATSTNTTNSTTTTINHSNTEFIERRGASAEGTPAGAAVIPLTNDALQTGVVDLSSRSLTCAPVFGSAPPADSAADTAGGGRDALDSIHTVILKNNRIAELDGAAAAPLISSPVLGGLAQLRLLTHLDVSHNIYLRRVTGLRALEHLQTLRLSVNQLTNTGQHHAQAAGASEDNSSGGDGGNIMDEILESRFFYHSLQVLDLSGNELRGAVLSAAQYERLQRRLGLQPDKLSDGAEQRQAASAEASRSPSPTPSSSSASLSSTAAASPAAGTVPLSPAPPLQQLLLSHNALTELNLLYVSRVFRQLRVLRLRRNAIGSAHRGLVFPLANAKGTDTAAKLPPPKRTRVAIKPVPGSLRRGGGAAKNSGADDTPAASPAAAASVVAATDWCAFVCNRANFPALEELDLRENCLSKADVAAAAAAPSRAAEPAAGVRCLVDNQREEPAARGAATSASTSAKRGPAGGAGARGGGRGVLPGRGANPNAVKRQESSGGARTVTFSPVQEVVVVGGAEEDEEETGGDNPRGSGGSGGDQPAPSSAFTRIISNTPASSILRKRGGRDGASGSLSGAAATASSAAGSSAGLDTEYAQRVGDNAYVIYYEAWLDFLLSHPLGEPPRPGRPAGGKGSGGGSGGSAGGPAASSGGGGGGVIGCPLVFSEAQTATAPATMIIVMDGGVIEDSPRGKDLLAFSLQCLLRKVQIDFSTTAAAPTSSSSSSASPSAAAAPAGVGSIRERSNLMVFRVYHILERAEPGLASPTVAAAAGAFPLCGGGEAAAPPETSATLWFYLRWRSLFEEQWPRSFKRVKSRSAFFTSSFSSAGVSSPAASATDGVNGNAGGADAALDAFLESFTGRLPLLKKSRLLPMSRFASALYDCEAVKALLAAGGDALCGPGGVTRVVAAAATATAAGLAADATATDAPSSSGLTKARLASRENSAATHLGTATGGKTKHGATAAPAARKRPLTRKASSTQALRTSSSCASASSSGATAAAAAAPTGALSAKKAAALLCVDNSNLYYGHLLLNELLGFRTSFFALCQHRDACGGGGGGSGAGGSTSAGHSASSSSAATGAAAGAAGVVIVGGGGSGAAAGETAGNNSSGGGGGGAPTPGSVSGAAFLSSREVDNFFAFPFQRRRETPLFGVSYASRSFHSVVSAGAGNNSTSTTAAGGVGGTGSGGGGDGPPSGGLAAAASAAFPYLSFGLQLLAVRDRGGARQCVVPPLGGMRKPPSPAPAPLASSAAAAARGCLSPATASLTSDDDGEGGGGGGGSMFGGQHRSAADMCAAYAATRQRQREELHAFVTQRLAARAKSLATITVYSAEAVSRDRSGDCVNPNGRQRITRLFPDIDFDFLRASPAAAHDASQKLGDAKPGGENDADSDKGDDLSALLVPSPLPLPGRTLAHASETEEEEGTGAETASDALSPGEEEEEGTPKSQSDSDAREEEEAVEEQEEKEEEEHDAESSDGALDDGEAAEGAGHEQQPGDAGESRAADSAEPECTEQEDETKGSHPREAAEEADDEEEVECSGDASSLAACAEDVSDAHDSAQVASADDEEEEEQEAGKEEQEEEEEEASEATSEVHQGEDGNEEEEEEEEAVRDGSAESAEGESDTTHHTGNEEREEEREEENKSDSAAEESCNRDTNHSESGGENL